MLLDKGADPRKKDNLGEFPRNGQLLHRYGPEVCRYYYAVCPVQNKECQGVSDELSEDLEDDENNDVNESSDSDDEQSINSNEAPELFQDESDEEILLQPREGAQKAGKWDWEEYDIQRGK